MSAEMFYEDLVSNYENDLQLLQDDEKLVPFYYMSSGDAIVVNDIGYSNSDLIWFHGFDSEQQSCVILVHVASAHLVLKVVKLQEAEERMMIGFRGLRDTRH